MIRSRRLKRWFPSNAEMQILQDNWFERAREQVRQGNHSATLEEMDPHYYCINTLPGHTVNVWRCRWNGIGNDGRNHNWPYPLLIVQRYLETTPIQPRNLLPTFQVSAAATALAAADANAGTGGAESSSAGGAAGSSQAFGRKVHKGPRGGRFVIKNGRKKYLLR